MSRGAQVGSRGGGAGALVSAVIAAALLTACAPDAPASRAAADSAPDAPASRGATATPDAAASPATAADADRPWATSSPTEAALEATSGDDVFLSYVWDLAMDSHGRVYVVDGSEPGIIVLKADLTHERTIGRDGEGPGEFGRAAAVQVLPGDTLLVWDVDLQRLTAFAPGSGEAASIHSPGTQQGISRIWRLPGDMGYLARSSTMYRADGSDQDSTRTEVLRHVREVDGRVADDVLYSYPAAERLVLRSEGRVSVAGHPFGRSSHVGLLGDGRIVHASSDAIEVRAIDLTGEVRTAVSHPTTYLPVSRQDLAEAADKLSAAMGRALRDGAPYIWPSLTGLVVDDAGRIWIGIRLADLTRWEWAAFLPDGTHQLSVELPAGVEVQAIGGGRMIGVALDELDTPRILAYRLP